jgi:ElaB/YqjD/DUF883 family membrane-anchored ribosome-binding protein
MDALNKNQSNKSSTSPSMNKPTMSSDKSRVGGAANELLNESKKLANEMYEGSMNKLSTAEEQMKQYSDHMLRKVQNNPLTSMLIAGGIGYILSKLLRK